MTSRRGLRSRQSLGIAAAAALGTIAWLGHGSTAPRNRPAFGFDHLVHAGQVSVAGKADIPCARCHRTDTAGRLRGRPDHSSCFGSCHGPPPASARTPGRKKLGRVARQVCARCHSSAELDRYGAGSRARLTVRFPPYSFERDYGVGFSHKKHDAPTRATRPGGCPTCHAPPPRSAARPRPAAHARCIGCHGSPRTKKVPPMKQCTACHLAAYGPANDPHQITGPYPVTSTFSHPAHASRLPPGGDCRTCHANVAATDAINLPSPTMKACASCHDGRSAFSTTGPSCTKCHREHEARLRRPVAPRRRFSHAAHRSRGLRLPCARCHTLAAGSAPRTAARDHTPCSDAGCHREEFGSTKPTICGACHTSSEPWRSLHHDRAPPATTEFGARFDHQRHLGGAKPRVQRACASCHQQRRGERELALPRDHAGCSGDSCHGPPAKAKPALTECNGCHVRGAMNRRTAARKRARFTVRNRFRHAPHLRSGNRPMPCASCHSGVLAAKTLAAVPTPPKARCVGCHDGRKAFKVTGHGCVRCHGGRK